MFEELPIDRRLRLGLAELELVAPTPVQAAVVPALLAGQDLQVRAETGSGKTLSYLLPAAQSLLARPPSRGDGTLVLILVPTRELARQVVKQGRALLAKSGLDIQGITGGADFKYQRAILRRNPEILVATPGRLLEHCEASNTDFTGLRLLVLDEADRMLELGFREDVLAINRHLGDDKQAVLLSATLKHRRTEDLAAALLRSPRILSLSSAREAHGNISHQRILVDGQAHRDQVLIALLGDDEYRRALVFANKRREADRLARLLTEQGIRCAALHGELRTGERKQVVSRLAEGKLQVVCASDLAARGLDISSIDLVINYDLPHSGDDYLHRTGRTGRAGANGTAVSLVGAAEWNLMISIQRYLNLTLEPRTLQGLKARFRGPKKLKNSGKRATSGKRPKRSAAGSAASRRSSATERSPRTARGPAQTAKNDGMQPLKKKKKPGGPQD